VLGQEHLERIFARSVGHRHRFKIDHRLIYGAASSRTVNLPAPLFGRIGSVLNDRGIVVWLKIDGHAEQYALSSHQRLVAVRWALYRNRLVISPLGRLPQAAQLPLAWMVCRSARPATRPPPLETAYDSAGRSIDPCPLWSDGPAACGQLSLPFCANPNCSGR
jgi:hypothetical protein